MTIFHYSLINSIISSLKSNRVKSTSARDIPQSGSEVDFTISLQGEGFTGERCKPFPFRISDEDESSKEGKKTNNLLLDDPGSWIFFREDEGLETPSLPSLEDSSSKEIPKGKGAKKQKNLFNYQIRSKILLRPLSPQFNKFTEEIHVNKVSGSSSPASPKPSSFESVPGKVKAISDWVCYSGHEGNFLSLDPEGKNVGKASFAVEIPKVKAYASASNQASDSKKSNKLELSAREFERQNILQCYQKKNLLGLFFAFFDYGTKELDERRAREMKLSVQEASEGDLRKGGENRFGLNAPLNSFPILKEMRKWKLAYLFRVLKKSGLAQLSRQWFNQIFRESSTLIVIQILLIPYTFIFGIFYTFTAFQLSSTSKGFVARPISEEKARVSHLVIPKGIATGALPSGITSPPLPSGSLTRTSPLKREITQKENANWSRVELPQVLSPATEGPLSAFLYSYSIELQDFPAELLRFSYLSSKIFMLWGFSSIIQNVKPKSSKNDFKLTTRLIPIQKNKKRFADVEGIEKFLPVLKTLVESFGKGSPSFTLDSKSALASPPTLTKNFLQRTVISEKNLSFNKKVFNHPKGYLFIGPPGTGKTLLAQAVAGEAQVNLICLSASEIQKQIDIGTRIGAIRLRNLFEQARKSTPCILFLDEIDAIGRARNESMDLKLFTEFLIQMDSFSVKDGFIVIGTTNFLSSLDSAFVRSGRFDRIIGLNYPGKQTRIAILKLYTKKGQNTFDNSISWNDFGEITKGLSAADLAKVVNESSLYLIEQEFGKRKNMLQEFHKDAHQELTSEKQKTSPCPQDPEGKSLNLLYLQGNESSKAGKEGKKAFFFLESLSSLFHWRKRTLIHTAASLKRGIERISNSPNK
jgi:hypothetical protein